MSLSNVYTAGINNVGSYQVSGRPFTNTGTQKAANATTKIEFPTVTKQIVFMNRGAASMYVHFSDSPGTANKFEIAAGEQHTFNVKCKEIYTYGTSGQGWTLYASLTHIPNERMFTLTGPGITE